MAELPGTTGNELLWMEADRFGFEIWLLIHQLCNLGKLLSELPFRPCAWG